MNGPLRTILVCGLLGAALTLSPEMAAAPSSQLAKAGLADSQYLPGEVLVKFKPTTSPQQRLASMAAYGHSIVRSLNQSGWSQVKVGVGQTVDAAIKAYRNDPNVEYAQANFVYHATAVPNDPQYSQLWAFKNVGQTVTSGSYVPTFGTPGDDINVEAAWDHITDCSSVVVAVVDSGVNYNQEDLAGNMWNGNTNHGWDFVDGDSDPMDLMGHGTHVAGIIGASGNNSIGVTGVCWKANIMAVRVVDPLGRGNSATLIQGINFAVANGAKVINMSIGGAIGGTTFDQALSDAITNAQNNDVVVIVAAGNESHDNDAAGNNIYPCNFTNPNLVCVAALDQNYALASSSIWGSNWGAISVDVGAPGTNIVSSWNGATNLITDTFNTGGVLNWTSSGGWAYEQLPVNGNPFDVLVNPSNFPSGTYTNNADDRAYKTFDLSGSDFAALNFYTQFAIQPGDFLNINYRAGGGDPFSGGVFLDGGSGTTNGIVGPLSYDISPCIGAACSVGFQLLTDASNTGQGVGILGFSVSTLKLNSTSYFTDDGTSMATPEVAGLAAMLRAYNPQFTYADTVNAIKNGGRPVSALVGKTTTGKAIDVMSTLAYINPPNGLTATVQ